VGGTLLFGRGMDDGRAGPSSADQAAAKLDTEKIAG
jgi:hypothetical protein